MPKFSLSFQPTITHKFSFSGNLNYLPVGAKNLHLFNVLEGNRTIKKNILSLELQRCEQLNLSYRHHEPFEFFTAFLGFYIKREFNTFLSSVTFDKNFTTTTYFRLPTNIINSGLNLAFDKLIPVLKSSFKYSANLGLMNFKNVVNGSELRNNLSQNQSHNLFIKTGFSLPFGFENNFSINRTKFVVNQQASTLLISIENKFKFLYKPTDKLLIVSTVESIRPQISQKTTIHFLDFELNYKPTQKPKTKIIEYRITGKNLLNATFFKTNQNSDFAYTTYQSNLIGRYLMLAIMFRL